MCSLKSDGNGGSYVRFGPKEWLGLVAILLTATALTAGLTGAWMSLKIEAAMAVHSVAPHPVTEQRLENLEEKAP